MMMELVKYRHFNWLLHVLAWSIVLFFPYFVAPANDQYRIGVLPGLYFTLSGLVHVLIFYANVLWLYPKLLNRKYWWLYVISVILLILFSVQLKFSFLEWWFPDDIDDIRTHVLFPSLMVFIVSVFYCIAADRLRAEKLQKEREALHLAIELKHLRSQISPHFLFNVLTNLVSLARKRSDKLEHSLVMLSGLMRYMFSDAGKKIPLQREVEYLDSYTGLQTLRFGRTINVTSNTSVPDEALNYTIEPMLLIPFVENAFKHGTAFIAIGLIVREGLLEFRVQNQFDETSNANPHDASGIGLQNVRSRLALLYPGRHELLVDKEKDLFTIHLTLKMIE